jgi:hypothetical protein
MAAMPSHGARLARFFEVENVVVFLVAMTLIGLNDEA